MALCFEWRVVWLFHQSEHTRARYRGVAVIDVDITVASQGQVVADVLRADVVVGAAAGDVHQRTRGIKRPSDVHAAVATDTHGRGRGAILEDTEPLVNAGGWRGPVHGAAAGNGNGITVTSRLVEDQ